MFWATSEFVIKMETNYFGINLSRIVKWRAANERELH